MLPDDGRSISRNEAHLIILVHDVINLLYYEYWTDKQKYFYVCLGSSRKFISRNKEFKFWHLQKFIKEKPYQPKTFNVVFNGARRINKTTIGLVQSGAEYNFYLLNFTRRV